MECFHFSEQRFPRICFNKAPIASVQHFLCPYLTTAISISNGSLTFLSQFQKILNKKDKHIQFTIEDEFVEKCDMFSGHKNKNNNGRYEFHVHRKPALTNVQIKPHSCILPDTITSIFKGFLARTTKICSEKYLRAE